MIRVAPQHPIKQRHTTKPHPNTIDPPKPLVSHLHTKTVRKAILPSGRAIFSGVISLGLWYNSYRKRGESIHA